MMSNEALASFSKNERLTGARLVAQLFDRTGRTYKCYPLMFVLRPVVFEDNAVCKVLFSVSKKRFKRAVDRNLIKRRMRAVHQLLKQTLIEQLAPIGNHACGIVYLSNNIENHQTILNAYQKFLHELDKTNK